MEGLKDRVLVGHGHCPHTGMCATGLPHTMHIAETMKGVQATVKELGEKVDQEKEQNAKNYQHMIDVIPKSCAAEVVRKVHVEGVVGVTQDDLERHLTSSMTQLSSDLKGFMDERLQDVSNGLRNPVSGDGDEGERSSGVGCSNWRMYKWGGRTHYFPEDYVLPTLTVKNAWDMWIYGNTRDGIAPFSFSKQAGSIRSRTQQVRFCKLRYVVDALLRAGDFTCEELQRKSHTEGNIVFCRSFKSLLASSNVFKSILPSRRGELTFTTFYNYLKKIHPAAAAVEATES